MEITKETLDKFGVSLREFASLLMCTDEIDESEIVATLDATKDKELVYRYRVNGSPYKYIISDTGKDLIERMSAYTASKESSIDFLGVASKMRQMFPKGIKEGTNSRWVDGLSLVAKRLRQFVEKYGEYSEDEILDATKRYVDSFNGNYQKMRTLRYFIWADKRNPGTGQVEYTSDLLSYIEDTEDTNLTNDWEVKLR